ncbi:hypothetical protein [Myroides marinus]|nr:hypothetical protein [Myroides marinus]
MSYSNQRNFKDTLTEVGVTLLVFTMVYGIVWLIHQILLLID